MASRSRLKVIIIIVCIAIITLWGILEYRNGADTDDYYYATVDGERIRAYHTGDDYYIFLPSYVDAEDIRLSSNAKRLDGDSLHIMESSNIAAIYIDLNNGDLSELYADKTNSLTAGIRTVNSDGSDDYSGKVTSIHGRGNYSWATWAKKPFTIRLSQSTSVLGMAAGYEYALVPNASDATLIRNDIAHGLEEAMGRECYMRGQFADLYIDGEYLGNYYMIPTVEVGSERVNITNLSESMDALYDKTNIDALDTVEEDDYKAIDLPAGTLSDITGGYIIEREFTERYDAEYDEFQGGIVTDSDEHFIVKSPSYIGEDQAIYLLDYMNGVEDAILNGDSQAKADRLDLYSFATRYLTEEITKNYDGATSSVYYYKDSDSVDSRLYAGPGWDYDMSLGNYLDWMEYSEQSAGGLTKLTNNATKAIWYEALYEDQDYLNIIMSTYVTKAAPYLQWLTDTGIDEYRERLAASASMDSIRWADMYEEWGYDPVDSSEYEKLKTFITDRKAFLDSIWTTE